jgi:hypothetical protein
MPRLDVQREPVFFVGQTGFRHSESLEAALGVTRNQRVSAFMQREMPKALSVNLDTVRNGLSYIPITMARLFRAICIRIR